MKVHGKKGKNFLLEVTPHEMDAIRLALMEWSSIEAETTQPDKRFDRVLNRIHKAQNEFDSLPLVKQRKLGSTKQLLIEDITPTPSPKDGEE